MRASLVIPTYNERDFAHACLLSLNHQRVAPGREFEVILADDGSSDGTGDIADPRDYDFPLRYLYRPRDRESSRPRARNMAAAMADGDVLLFVDGDQVVPPGFVDSHLSVHEYRDDAVVTGPRSAFGRGTADLELLRREFTLDAFPPLRRHDVRHEVLAEFSYNLNALATRWHLIFACNFSVRRAHFDAVGGFDTDLLGWGLEDTELAYRLDRHGLRFVWVDEARLLHPRVPGSSAAGRCAGWRANMRLFLDKHQDPEVSVLQLFRRFYSMNPDLTWTEAARRTEYAVRALRGESGADAEPATVVVADDAAELARRLERGELMGDVDIVDPAADPWLAVVAQCTDTGGRIRYRKPLDPGRISGMTI